MRHYIPELSFAPTREELLILSGREGYRYIDCIDANSGPVYIYTPSFMTFSRIIQEMCAADAAFRAYREIEGD